MSVILSKFHPALELLSGLIFNCPVPSPAVPLRVKSTILREFSWKTKVCEQKINFSKMIHSVLVHDSMLGELHV